MCDCIEITSNSGLNGKNGSYGGYSLPWKFDTALDSRPSTGYFQFDNIAPSLVTTIYQTVTNADSYNATSFLASFVNSNNFGTLRLFAEFDNTRFVNYLVTNVADNRTSLTVTYIGGSGTFNP